MLIALAMIALPVVESLSRRLLGRDLPGSLQYVQHLTLWIGFVGALLATAGGRHLGLATASFLPPGWLRAAAEWVSTLTFVAVTLLLGYASARVVGADRLGSKARLPGGIRVWQSELIMPLGFVLMAVRAAFRPTRPAAGRALPISWRTWAARGLVILLAAAALALGLVLDRTEALRGTLAQLAVLHGPLRWAGVLWMLGAFLLGAPVFVAMAGLAMVLFFNAGTPIAAVPVETFRLTQNPSLPAIPLLTIAGYVLASGDASRRLLRVFRGMLGWLPGGLAVMAVFLCAFFTTLTGASGVTILALGGLIYPMLVAEGYPERFALGLVTASGSLGLLFPPSLPVILYGVAASAPGSAVAVGIDQLFIGGLIPGTLMVVLVCLSAVHLAVRCKLPRQPFRGREALRALWEARWDLLLPVIIIGAFASGLATVVEAAALGAAYAVLVQIFLYRDVHPLRDLPGVLTEAAALVGAVVVLLGVAMGLTAWLVQAEAPVHLVEWVQLHVRSRWIFLLSLNLILLVLGSVLEIYSAIVVLVPLLAPLGPAYQINPVHLGVIFLANLELGFLLPPMGLNLFLSAARFQRPLPVLYRAALPFLGIMGAGVLLITYVEGATTVLLRLLGKCA